MIHFELHFMKGLMSVSRINLFNAKVQLLQHHLLEKLSFLQRVVIQIKYLNKNCIFQKSRLIENLNRVLTHKIILLNLSITCWFPTWTLSFFKKWSNLAYRDTLPTIQHVVWNIVGAQCILKEPMKATFRAI